MKDLFWLASSFIHSFLHVDTAYITLIFAGFRPWLAIGWIIIFSSFWTLAFFWANKKGINFSVKASGQIGRVVANIRRWSHFTVKRWGYPGLILLCLTPYVPCVKEAGLLAGQVMELRHTLSVMLFFNALRLVLLLQILS